MVEQDQPLLVEIIAYAPTAFYHCTHCEVVWHEAGLPRRIHQEQVEASLPADLTQDYQRISDWVREIFSRHCDRVAIKIIDAASLEGVIKSLRYGVRRYPAVVVDRRSRFPSGALDDAADEIARLLETGQPAQD